MNEMNEMNEADWKAKAELAEAKLRELGYIQFPRFEKLADGTLIVTAPWMSGEEVKAAKAAAR